MPRDRTRAAAGRRSTLARKTPLRNRTPLRRRTPLKNTHRLSTRRPAITPLSRRIIADRPAPPHAGLRGPTYCDGPDAWQPGCGRCATCGGEIAANAQTGRRARYFCANAACRRWWRQNHQWDIARAATLQRDRRCVRPRCASATVRVQVDHVKPLADTTFERAAERPARTKYRTGCHNHLSNLQVLCGAHHAAKTAADARNRNVRKPVAS